MANILVFIASLLMLQPINDCDQYKAMISDTLPLISQISSNTDFQDADSLLTYYDAMRELRAAVWNTDTICLTERDAWLNYISSRMIVAKAFMQALRAGDTLLEVMQ